ncbi:MAG: chemotaxis protein CheW [Alphaproteobacteria bacterium]|nr:chemotaxis protein CheW [Alphaproteobacteria bacterium]
MDDLVQEFLTETSESINALDIDIVRLEQNPNDKDLISRIFRLVHTIKGTCGFLGLPRLEKVAHHSENIMGRYREGSLQITEETVSLIFEAIDRIKTIVAGIAATGTEIEGDDEELIAKLDAVYKSKSETNLPVKEESVLEPVDAESATPPSANDSTKNADSAQTALPSKSVEEKTLRVDVNVLENLMTMVSELVLTRNQLLQILRTEHDSPFTPPLQRLSHVVSELQEGVMQTRMQPVGNAWSKLPRIIRDINVELGKKINLDMRGSDTELDRQVLEFIKDPLTHMVRNSGDHGIETPEERLAAGKHEEGTVLLNAFHEGGHIVIEISDDGRGLNMDKIRKKVLEQKIATEEQLKTMTDQQIQQFIFDAGFSTADKVTAVSGRGVGMDVVRTNIEKIGGTIEMKSIWKKGTTFTIKIPLTLAIVSALIIEAGGERFAIPQISVQELVRLSGQGDNRLEEINDTPIMRLRNRLLPLVALGKVLELEKIDENKNNSEGECESKDETNSGIGKQVIVVEVGAQTFGIVVDRVFDTEEIVVKPVSPILKGIRIFSGNTILGDGSVIMILDPNGIANTIGNMADVEEENNKSDENSHTLTDSESKTSLLIFKAGEGASRAVPLSLVARLEEFDVEKIEFSGHQKVVQYRGNLMPLIPFNDLMKQKEQGGQSVLVFSDRERSMGLMVDEIVDIVEETVNVEIKAEDNFGLLGSAVIHDQATDVIDVGHFLSIAHPDWFGTKDSAGFEQKGGAKKVLLVDDSPFFRNMISPMLSIAGYQVISIQSGQEALDLCDAGEKFDVIVSDIEMPGMDGYEFALKIKADDSKWKNVPLVALSSHATTQDVDRGKAAGFDDYIAKFDREALLQSIAQKGEVA